AIQVNEIWWPNAKHGAEPLRERAALILVIGVGASAQDAAQMVPDLAARRVLVGNGGRLGDEVGDSLQRPPRRLARGAIGLVVRTRKGDQRHVIRHLQLLQYIKRAVRDAAVGRVRKTLGENEQARANGHAESRRAVFTRPSARPTSA